MRVSSVFCFLVSFKLPAESMAMVESVLLCRVSSWRDVQRFKGMYESTLSSNCWHARSIKLCDGSVAGVKVRPVSLCFTLRTRAIFSANGIVLASLDSVLSALDRSSSKASAWLSKNNLRAEANVPAGWGAPKVRFRKSTNAVSSA